MTQSVENVRDKFQSALSESSTETGTKPDKSNKKLFLFTTLFASLLLYVFYTYKYNLIPSSTEKPGKPLEEEDYQDPLFQKF